MNADVATGFAALLSRATISWPTLIDLLIKSTALLSAGLLFDAALRRRRPLACATMWNAVLAALIVLPAAEWLLPKTPLLRNIVARHAPQFAVGETAGIDDAVSHAPVALREAAAAADQGTTATLAPPPQPAPAAEVPSSPPLRRYAGPLSAGVYFVGLSWALVRLAAACRAVSRLRRSSAPVDDEAWRRRFAYWVERFGLGDRVELRASERVNVPLVVGRRRPAVVLPRDVLERATPATRDAVLAHELTHVARCDYAWQLVLRIVQACWWFHPLVRLVERRIDYARERVCDGYTVHRLGSAEQYADALLEMAGRLAKRRSLGLGLAVVRSSRLGERLAAIYELGGSSRYAASLPARAVAASAALGLAVALGHTAFAQVAVSRQPGLPAEADAAVASFESEASAILRRAREQIGARREQTITRLQTLQDEYTREAKLDEAVAIRDQIRALRGVDVEPSLHAYPTPQPSVVMPDPGTLLDYRGFDGRSVSFRVTGDAGQIHSIWGTDVYTDDSWLAAAAVHAGLLKVGETGVVRVTILPGRPSYRGSTRNGVSSRDYGPFPGSFRVESVEHRPLEDRRSETSPPTSATVVDRVRRPTPQEALQQWMSDLLR